MDQHLKEMDRHLEAMHQHLAARNLSPNSKKKKEEDARLAALAKKAMEREAAKREAAARQAAAHEAADCQAMDLSPKSKKNKKEDAKLAIMAKEAINFPSQIPETMDLTNQIPKYKVEDHAEGLCKSLKIFGYTY